MDTERLQEILDGTKPVTAERLKELHEEYPYWIFPDVAYVRESKENDDDLKSECRRRIASSVGNIEALETLVGDSGDVFDDFYESETKRPNNTDEVIDRFLDEFGTGVPSPRLTMGDDIDPLAGILVPDVEAAMLLDESTEDSTAQEEDANDPGDAKREALVTENGVLTESLAMFFIKNGNYSKAFEIFNELSLNNSQKSIYFADQMRFLRKLIINEKKL